MIKPKIKRSKKMKKITASESLIPVIERGAAVDVEIKNLTFEDKGIKAKIGEEAGHLLTDGESSVRISAKTSVAVVTRVEKVELDAGAEGFETVASAVKMGDLKSVVERKLTIMVPPDKVEAAAKLLAAANIDVAVKESYDVDPAAYRAFVGSTQSSPEGEAIRKSLEKVARKTETFRVKYDKA
jgi:hypothetical protein